MICDATFSADGRARFTVSRIWDERLPLAAWLMANPSKAGKEDNDPTVLRVIHFSRKLRAGGFVGVNWNPWVDSDPLEAARQLGLGVVDPYLSENLVHIGGAAAKAKFLVVAFGVPPMSLLWHVRRAYGAFSRGDRDLLCLGTTKGGWPLHPMARGRWRVIPDVTPFPYDGGSLS
jgi:hypothetical protein